MVWHWQVAYKTFLKRKCDEKSEMLKCKMFRKQAWSIWMYIFLVLEYEFTDLKYIPQQAEEELGFYSD